MSEEVLKIFDQEGNPKGIATRKEVHKKGLWHETFHCWLISLHKGEVYLYFQLRCEQKKDYPNLLDITAAGHLLANETVEDGVRELKEEIGVDLSLNDLISLGIIKEQLNDEVLLDNELCHVFLYEIPHSFDSFFLQKEEVSGIFRAKLQHFYSLWNDRQLEMKSEGFIENEEREKMFVNKMITKQNFVPHEKNYIENIVRSIQNVVDQK